MYDKGSAIVGTGVSGAGLAALAHTGANVIWLFLAAFALIAAGTALWRVTPRKQR